MMQVILILSIFLSSCGLLPKHEKSEDNSLSDYDRLKDKYTYYVNRAVETSAFNRWVNDECDALLFTALVSHIPALKINLMQAFDGNRWHRRPISMGECYPKESKSTISRDMLLGVLWYALKTKNSDITKQLIEYGKSHAWKMGDGDIARIVMSPAMITTTYMIQDKITSKKTVDVETPLVLDKLETGYEAHLGVLHALLRAELKGFASIYLVDYFKAQYERQSQNLLFKYAYYVYTAGNLDEIASNLLEETYFPVNKNLSNEVKCEPWLWQRDFGSDWQPCEKAMVHSGYDFLFLADLILSENHR